MFYLTNSQEIQKTICHKNKEIKSSFIHHTVPSAEASSLAHNFGELDSAALLRVGLNVVCEAAVIRGKASITHFSRVLKKVITIYDSLSEEGMKRTQREVK